MFPAPKLLESGRKAGGMSHAKAAKATKGAGGKPLSRQPFSLRTRRSASLPSESAAGGSRFRATLWLGNACEATEKRKPLYRKAPLGFGHKGHKGGVWRREGCRH